MDAKPRTHVDQLDVAKFVFRREARAARTHAESVFERKIPDGLYRERHKREAFVVNEEDVRTLLTVA